MTDTRFPAYTVIQLPGAACWAVMSADGRRRAVCDRESDAQRIAYALRIVDESEETARRDESKDDTIELLELANAFDELLSQLVGAGKISINTARQIKNKRSLAKSEQTAKRDEAVA